MPMYARLGEVPPKRHTQLRRNGKLLTEQVMGMEGFSGNYSILYHLETPCRVQALGGFRPIAKEEWVPEQHQHHLFNTANLEADGDPIEGRRLLMWNDDVEIWFSRPAQARPGYFRNGEGDEVIFVHEGSGTVESIFGSLPYRQGDYVVIPRGTTYRLAFEGSQRHLVFVSPSQVEIPSRYRNEYGNLLEHAPMYHRDLHGPVELQTYEEQGEFRVTVRIRGGLQDYVLDYHPFNVVGWDGYVYPWTFNIGDYEPKSGRIHQPPPAHQTFQGHGYVICSFCPRKLEWDPQAVPIPYNHSNLQSDEMIYYVSGNFGSRKGIEVGAITLHPYGIPHGPQPGLAEKALGATKTEELAVMCDTFRPLRLSKFSSAIDHPEYMFSWYTPATTSPDEIPTIA
ncbi:MAG TPA: homogentisate 1,2-dioxygenase [Acidimicrobiia bacterium]|jgi:homogentisate 1,2-dioxygenase